MREWETYGFITEQSWEGCSDLASEAVSEMLVVGDVHGDWYNSRWPSNPRTVTAPRTGT